MRKFTRVVTVGETILGSGTDVKLRSHEKGNIIEVSGPRKRLSLKI